jgi:branched-chain amino acid transport system ATP-binding protein
MDAHPGTPPPDGNVEAAPTLVLTGVGVRFGGVVAVADTDLHVGPAEVCGLIGPNGAGKTTLFDVISGVRRPNSGTVVVDGQDITNWSPVQRSRAGIRRTFQQAQVFTWLTVEENVLAALDWHGGGGGAMADLLALPSRRSRERVRRERVAEVLDRCGLAAVADVQASSLPIGLARMLELARAIADPPKLLLLDEPTSGLDAAEAQRLAHQVDAVRLEHGCGVVLVEHDVSFVMDNCDRVVVLNLGRILATGTPREIRSNKAVRDAYLGQSGDHGAGSVDPK